MTVQPRTNTKRRLHLRALHDASKARPRGLDETWHGSRFSNPVQESSQVRGTTICNG